MPIIILHIIILCICLLIRRVNTMDEMFVLYEESDNNTKGSNVQDYESQEVQEY